MQKLSVIFLLICFPFIAKSQHLGAYTDFRGHFFIFDHGESIQAEDIQVESFKIGGECVLYINSQGNLKIYKDGKITKLEPGGITKYFATDHLAGYNIFDQLYVVINSEPVRLSRRCPVFQVQDSLIVYYDQDSYSLNIFYNGDIHVIESGLIGVPITHLASGDNIIAYISSRTKDFKIWYNGTNHTIINYIDGIVFKAGKDIVAYTKNTDNTFHVFYKGTDTQLEEFLPKSFKTGDGFIAYVDNMGTFKVFADGEVITISSFAPDAYYTDDNLLVFAEYERLKVFYNGEIVELEGYIPQRYRWDWNTLAYTDNSSRIWLYKNGEKKYLMNDLIESFDVYRDLILIKAKGDRNLIYYQDQFYTGKSFW